MFFLEGLSAFIGIAGINKQPCSGSKTTKILPPPILLMLLDPEVPVPVFTFSSGRGRRASFLQNMWQDVQIHRYWIQETQINPDPKHCADLLKSTVVVVPFAHANVFRFDLAAEKQET
jgi:hypothetical protein